ncbi:clostripain-related cysteine peptidase [Clostridium lundense]|uniref:clostripain-related cysteine peptidase n=1 Tax=Clostridium lundense TaxID=319475 RepID=UPI000687F1A4|nr:clostripain-related cysteine peptidase [Clostridium lundense]
MKNWTLLIYANGNNEMEPEIFNSFLSAKKAPSTKNINVVMQIGRADKTLVKLINPSKIIFKDANDWCGVRRYLIDSGEAILLEDDCFPNMAHPKNLYNFIKWGVEKFPAKHYMLILSGHGISYIGGLTDTTLDEFYIMGIPEMCQAINSIKKDLNTHIDILLLDMCYMNLIEVLYELGHEEKPSCKEIVTYFRTGPLEGIPLEKLIISVEKNIHIESLDLFTKNLINDIELPLISYNPSKKELEMIKDYFNILAKCYLAMEYKDPKKIYNLMNKSKEEIPCNIYIDKINDLLSSLIVYTNSISTKNYINVICTDLGKAIVIYKKLSFSKNNNWTEILSNYKEYDESKEISLLPIKLSNGAIYSFLSNLNPELSGGEVLQILSKLRTYYANNK